MTQLKKNRNVVSVSWYVLNKWIVCPPGVPEVMGWIPVEDSDLLTYHYSQ